MKNEDKNEKHVTEDPDVNHPSHYTSGSIECIDAMSAMMSASEVRGLLRGNVLKYLWRFDKKNGLQDLKKARWYLDKLIETEEKND